MVPAGEQKRREIFYSGHVQGVGFRYTVRSVASQFAVAGYVRNMPDGRVLLVVEGEEAEVALFLRTVRKEMDRYIASVEETVWPATGRFDGFDIRF